MLQVESVHKQFATKVLFNDASAHLRPHTRVGLVGPNGTGKTTLFKMILGEESPDEGTIRKRPRLRIGYLPQELETITGKTALDAAHRDEYPEHEAKRILSGLGSSEADFHRPVDKLSGGYRMRVALAHLLLSNPDVLMLDEPTNHLDKPTQRWFEEFLLNSKLTLLVISQLIRWVHEGPAGFVLDNVITWAPLRTCQGTWADYNGDGHLDLLVVHHSTLQGNTLYRNNARGQFEVVQGIGLDQLGESVGAAWGDFDNDGFPDVFIANGTIFTPQQNGLYRNLGNSNSWIKLKCVGTLSNRSAIGTKIRVEARISGVERWQTRQISGSEGWLEFNALDLIIGLGDARVIDLLRLEWPSGVIQEIPNVPVNQTLVIVEPIQVAALQVPSTGSETVGLRLGGATSRPLQVVASSDLVRWSALELDRQESDLLSVRDPEALTAPYRFYRVLDP